MKSKCALQHNPTPVSDLTDKYIKLNTVQTLTGGVRLRKEIEQQNDAIDDG
ncbi:hypothetical protein ABVN80_08270 [Acinetobacter baumannii]